jgi:hypothetical protein
MFHNCRIHGAVTTLSEPSTIIRVSQFSLDSLFTFIYIQGYKRRIASSEMIRRVALVRTDVSEELSTSFIRESRIGELGTTLALTRTRGTLRRNWYFFAARVGC